ncbi:MAG: NAD(P)/FAD-dependent oxidoreductase [Corynebacteriales bacterium]|nr:NAD(P)/FAD-dependent oxidoreductase [Mycobacteriales bacterium]
MALHEVDVVVLGLGPGGEHAAAELARAGLTVVGVEKHLVGGECPYYGCIPSKMLIRAANSLAEARRVSVLAGSAEVHPDFAVVAERISKEATDAWDDTVAADRLKAAGAQLRRGSGTLVGPRRVRVGEDEYRAGLGVLLNTGTAPAVPPIPGLAETPFWTNRDIVQQSKLPRSLVVLGGGAVGVEMAQAFARFGSEVTIIEAGDRLIAAEEPESSKVLREVLSSEGIHIHLGASVESVTHQDTFTLTLKGGTQVIGERLLVAAGRDAGLKGLGLANAGTAPAGRRVAVDEHMRAADGLWAIGDITGHGAFTHMSMYQAKIAIQDILGRPGPTADYRAVPHVTFTDPEIGAVGLSERQARDAGLRIAIGKSSVPESSRGWIHKIGNEGFFKIVVDADRDVLVGASAVGPNGGEVLGMLTLAIAAEVPTTTIGNMITAYPTFHRGLQTAFENLKTDGQHWPVCCDAPIK